MVRVDYGWHVGRRPDSGRYVFYVRSSGGCGRHGLLLLHYYIERCELRGGERLRCDCDERSTGVYDDACRPGGLLGRRAGFLHGYVHERHGGTELPVVLEYGQQHVGRHAAYGRDILHVPASE